MSDIFEEAKHELQQEKFHVFIKKHYKGVIAFIALIIISTGTYVYFKEENIRKQEKLSKEYYKLFIANNKINKAKEAAFGKLTVFEKSIYEKFAKLEYANALVDAKNYGKALQLLFDVIETQSSKPEICNIAKIRAAEIVMKYKVHAYKEKTIDILKKATRKKTTPYFYILKFLLGQLMIDSNKQKEALDVLASISKDEQAPNNIKFLSNAILGNYLR